MHGQDEIVAKMNEIIRAVNGLHFSLMSMDYTMGQWVEKQRRYDGPLWVAPSEDLIDIMEDIPAAPGSVEPVEYDDDSMTDADVVELPSGWNT